MLSDSASFLEPGTQPAVFREDGDPRRSEFSLPCAQIFLEDFQVKGVPKMVKTILAVDYLPVAALKPKPRNPRSHTKKQLRQIANSIIAGGGMRRACCTVELDHVDVDTILSRGQFFTGLSAVHETTRRAFAQREEEMVDVR
jgi:hypothetical protein